MVDLTDEPGLVSSFATTDRLDWPRSHPYVVNHENVARKDSMDAADMKVQFGGRVVFTCNGYEYGQCGEGVNCTSKRPRYIRIPQLHL